MSDCVYDDVNDEARHHWATERPDEDSHALYVETTMTRLGAR